jgi:hypothetical protein
MTDTVNLGLPYIDAAQAQKHVTHNEALRILDALVHLAVLDRDLAAPPGTPSEGQRWIVAASPTGAGAGHATPVAAWQDGGWQFSVPRVGWLVYVIDESSLLAWDGSAWTDALGALAAIQNLGRLGILTTASGGTRLAVKADAALFSHDDVTPGSGNMHVTLNKSAAGNDAGLLLQDGFGTRALLGLLGDDRLTVKVTPDGATYYTGLVVDQSNGQVELPLAPKFSAYTNFDNYIAADTWTKLQFNNADSNDQNVFSGASNNFTAPFAGLYAVGFSLRFKANAALPTKVIVTFYRNGAELGRGRAVSGAPVDDVTTFNLSVLTPLAAADVIDVRVNFAGNDGYVKSAQSHFWGYYVP